MRFTEGQIECIQGLSPMSQPSSDRNLLFGILALQMDFISRDALIAAMHAWVLQKGTPLAEILLSQAAVGKEEYDLLQAMVAKHLQVHDNDPRKSLAALSSIGSARGELARLGDADVEARLAHVSIAPGNNGS